MLTISNFIKFCKRNKQNILLVVIVFLAVLLAFGAGMTAQFYLSKPPLIIEAPSGE